MNLTATSATDTYPPKPARRPPPLPRPCSEHETVASATTEQLEVVGLTATRGPVRFRGHTEYIPQPVPNFPWGSGCSSLRRPHRGLCGQRGGTLSSETFR